MYHEPKFEPVRAEMYKIMKQKIHPLKRVERVRIQDADQRYLAETLRAEYSLPNLPASDFDGIAVRFEDFENGMPDTSKWKEGVDFVYSNTGVAIPEEFDTIIAIEDVVKKEDGTITLQAVPQEKGEYVNPVGSQMKEGEVLGEEGEKIHPALVGILAGAGYQSVPVYCKPRVVFLPTGDELVPSGGKVDPGKNVESNGVMVSSYVKRFGGEPSVTKILQDDQDILEKAILSAVKQADLVIIGAGSSKGSKDFTMDVLEKIGEVIVQEIGVAPGKHCSLTMVNDVPVLGIPGPPGGAQLISQYYVKAAIELLLTGKISQVQSVPAILDEDLNLWQIDFMQPVILTYQADGCHAVPGRGFGDTRARGRFNWYAVTYCEKGKEYKKGDQILVEFPLL